jgi:Uma2 family endonuclease
MSEYLASGLRLGWLINQQQQQVENYPLNSDVENIHRLFHLRHNLNRLLHRLHLHQFQHLS